MPSLLYLKMLLDFNLLIFCLSGNKIEVGGKTLILIDNALQQNISSQKKLARTSVEESDEMIDTNLHPQNGSWINESNNILCEVNADSCRNSDSHIHSPHRFLPLTPGKPVSQSPPLKPTRHCENSSSIQSVSF